jgi:hypothetical protein
MRASQTATSGPEEYLLNKTELARLLGLSLRTVDRLDIPRIKLKTAVRYRRSSVLKWLDKREGRA